MPGKQVQFDTHEFCGGLGNEVGGRQPRLLARWRDRRWSRWQAEVIQDFLHGFGFFYDRNNPDRTAAEFTSGNINVEDAQQELRP